MTFKKTLLVTLCAFGASVAAAQAATIPNVSGNVCEGGVKPADASGCPTALNLGDFNSNVVDPTLEIVGDTRIWGGVAHRNTNQNKYEDNFTLDLGTASYVATFNWQAVSANFDGEIVVGGTSYSFTTPPSTGSIDLGVLTGNGITFIINPIAGVFPDSPDEVGTWDLQLSQFPLPAGAVLLLTALGGMGVARGAKRKA
jgi:hypothetical protein